MPAAASAKEGRLSSIFVSSILISSPIFLSPTEPAVASAKEEALAKAGVHKDPTPISAGESAESTSKGMGLCNTKSE